METYLWSVLGDLSNERRRVLLHILIGVLEGQQCTREDVGLDNHLGKVDVVLGNLAECREYLTLERRQRKLR